MDAMASMWETFSLTEHEDDIFDLDPSLESPAFVLAAKFFTRRTVNVEAIARTFKPLWKTARGFTVKDMGENRMVFTFEDEVDLERVLLNEPWTYDKYLVILQRVDSDVSIDSMVFSTVPFWVQIHGLPIWSLTGAVAEGIGNSLGRVEKFLDHEGFAGGGSYVQIRIHIDCTKPLCRGRRTRLGGGQVGWISFKYERLPNFCYHCGLLTHDVKDCEDWIRCRGVGVGTTHQYGDWLRAPADFSGKTRMVSVLGSRRETAKEGAPMERTTPPTVATETVKSNMETTATLHPYMETTDSQGCDPKDPILKNVPPVNYADQLSEIDRDTQKFQTENFRGEHESSRGDMEFGSSKLQAQMPLRPIFNATQQKTNKITWKKMARAVGQSPNKPAPLATIKRTREAEEEIVDMDGKKRCGPMIESRLETLLSAEATTQPRREP